MTHADRQAGYEPFIAVGLVDKAESVLVRFTSVFSDAVQGHFAPGEYRFTCSDGMLHATGPRSGSFPGLSLVAADASEALFGIEATIGIGFHWQQKQMQTFSGNLRLVAQSGNRLTAINDVPLEVYILSVSCSEMSAESPAELTKAHSIISRSWLMAQLEQKSAPLAPPLVDADTAAEINRWYDRQAHEQFDVCADDHCQRYQGIGMIAAGPVKEAVENTRGQVLTYKGQVCDARFSKCCGGVTEDFRLAWSDTGVPYLIAFTDAPSTALPNPPLSDEQAVRKFIASSPDVYCNCTNDSILSKVLNAYDRTTHDFFRWRVRLDADEAGELIQKKLGLELGRILAIEPVERGLSGRLKRLRLVGEKRTVIIGKELEIRRALSPTHLYSSAFIVDTEGPAAHPDAFILSGAGWGHGVGLCQIGAAVMASRGIGYRDILSHYYPATAIEQRYE